MAQTGYVLEQTGEQIQEILNTATPQTSLEAEVERAQGAEGTLQGNIDAEERARKQADDELNLLIQQVQTSLVNYYMKTETYSAAQIDQMLAAIKQFRYLVVDELPTPSAETMGIIYLIPSAHSEVGNVKDEYITLTRDEGSGTIYYFEQIGSTAVDLSSYSTTAQMNAAIAAALTAYYNKQETDALLALKQNTISDLSTIRSGAAAGATAYQKPSGGIPSTDLTTELQAALASFITKTVNDLTNYYLKSDTYTKAEVQQLVDAVKQFTYVSVAELPTASADTMNKIYLVPTTNPQQQNVKDEYITISLTDQGTTTYSWEQIGSTAIDLSGYYTSAQTDTAITNALNTALASYSNTLQMNTAISTALNNYYTKTETDTMLNGKENTISDLSTIRSGAAAGATAYQKPSGGIPSTDLTSELQAALASFITKTVNDLTNYYLKSDTYTKAEVQQLVDAVKQFTYVSVAELPTASADTMNKIYLVPTTNPQQQNVKDEYITISLTDQGTTTYSWEQIGSTAIDLSGYYTSAQTDTAITNALNTALASYSNTAQMNAAIAAAILPYYTKTEIDTLLAGKENTISDLSTIRSGAAAGATAYQKPSGGIPSTDLTAELQSQIASFITASVNNLVNYYLKSDTYTKAEVQQLVDAVKQFTYVSISALPTASADTMNKIYLVPSSSPQTQNVKDEYITISLTDQGTTTYSWEQIGSTEVNLSGYYTSVQTDAAITNALNTALASYMTSSQVTQAITLALDNVYTKSADDAGPLNANRQKTVINSLTAKTNSTGFSSTDLIQLYANDGTPNGKISRDDLMGVFKDLLPSLLSSQSNTTDFLGIDSNGIGKASLATAASLLGAQLKINLNSSDSPNNLYEGIGFKTCVSDSQSPNPNGNLFYVGMGTNALQLFCYNYADANLFWYRYRTNNSWGNWISLKG